MSEFVEFLPGAEEPITLAEVRQQLGLDDDLTVDDTLITQIFIPGARAQAESRTGACIKQARFVQRLPTFPLRGGSISIDHSLAQTVESVTYIPQGSGARVPLNTAAYEVSIGTRESLLDPVSTDWPDSGQSLRAVEITYTAGATLDSMRLRYPNVRLWLLMAAVWGYDNRSLFAQGRTGFEALPDTYYSSMLSSISVPPRF